MSSALTEVTAAVELIGLQAQAMVEGRTDDEVLDRQLPGELGSRLGSSIGRWREVSETSSALNALNEAIAEATLDAQLLCDHKLKILTANPAARNLFGECPRGLIGVDVDEILKGAEVAAFTAKLKGRKAGTISDARAIGAGGALVPVSVSFARVEIDAGVVYSILVRDLSERVAFVERLAHETSHDSLTGLATRQVLLERLADAAASGPVGLVHLDLDRSKELNSRIGQDDADRVIAAIARRLDDGLRSGTLVARLGGDEFAVLMPGASTTEEVAALGERLLEGIRHPVIAGGRRVSLTASAGVGQHAGGSADELLTAAMLALRHAKRRGGDQLVAHDDEFVASLERTERIHRELEAALTDDELELCFQPVWDAIDGTMVGAEALVRWPRSDQTVTMPSEFIPVAEETGLIVRLDEWVLDACAKQLAAWSGTELAHLRVSVNISARHLADGDLVSVVRRAQSEYDIGSHQLAVEITESYLAEDLDRTREVLESISALGVALLIDDFGTGYSSLAYLQELPFDVLKIDRSFVAKLDDRTGVPIVEALVGLGHTMGLRVLAEGVETSEELEALRRLGCDELQGFVLTRPQSVAALEAMAGQSHGALMWQGSSLRG